MVVVLIIVLVAAIDGLMSQADYMMSDLWNMVFNIESVIPSNTYSDFLSNLKTAFYSAAVLLMIVKFLKKLFDIYALWSEGDPDAEPMQLVINFVKALVVAICFPYLWNIFTNVGKDLLDKGLEALNGTGSFEEMWGQANWQSLGLIPTIYGLVFLIFVIILGFKFMKRGIEVSLMIVGMPLACIGLLDNDKGIFKPYLNQFAKLLVSTLFQILTLKLSLSIAFTANIWDGTSSAIYWAIPCLMLANSIPAILQEFMIPTNHNGGVMAKAYSVGMLASLVRNFTK